MDVTSIQMGELNAHVWSSDENGVFRGWVIVFLTESSDLLFLEIHDLDLPNEFITRL